MKHLALILALLPAAALAEGTAVPVGSAVLFGEAPQVRLPPGAAPGNPALLVLLDPASDLVEIVTVPLGAPVDTGDEGLQGFAPGPVPATETFAGFAFTLPFPAIRIQGGTAQADVTGDGVPDLLRLCLTMEALRFEIEDGAAPGSLVWQDYVPLGYDVEPTCGQAP